MIFALIFIGIYNQIAIIDGFPNSFFYFFSCVCSDANLSSYGIIPVVHVALFNTLAFRISLIFNLISGNLGKKCCIVLSQRCADIGMPECINSIIVALWRITSVFISSQLFS